MDKYLLPLLLLLVFLLWSILVPDADWPMIFAGSTIAIALMWVLDSHVND